MQAIPVGLGISLSGASRLRGKSHKWSHLRYGNSNSAFRPEENARAYQDLARAEARRLPEYEPDDEESTARHDVPAPIIHTHVHMESVHDTDPPAKKRSDEPSETKPSDAFEAEMQKQMTFSASGARLPARSASAKAAALRLE